MRPEGVAAAARELRRAERACKRIASAETNEDADEAWSHFLAHASNVYAKLYAASRGHPRDWSWYCNKLGERSKDSLLLYIHKARNCEIHRLEVSTVEVPAGPQIMHIPGWGRVHVKCPRHLRLLSVTDQHGNVYEVPTSHKGIEFANLDAGLIAFIGCGYLQGLIKEASSRLR